MAHHALRRRNGPGELMRDRVPRLVFGNRRIGGSRLAFIAELRVGSGVFRIPVVRVRCVAGRAAGRPVVASLLVGAQEPQVWIVQPCLGDIDKGHGDAVACARPPIGLAHVGAPRFVKLLQRATHIGQPDLGKLRAIDLAAAFEHPKHVGGRHRLPCGQWCQAVQNAHRAHLRIGCYRVLDECRFTRCGVGLTEDVALERQDAIVVGRAAPQHGTGGHQAAFGRLHDGQMASAAGFTRHAQVARVDEADELRAFAVQLGVTARRVGGGRVVPLERKTRQYM